MPLGRLAPISHFCIVDLLVFKKTNEHRLTYMIFFRISFTSSGALSGRKNKNNINRSEGTH